jgi:hypothetical protein
MKLKVNFLDVSYQVFDSTDEKSDISKITKCSSTVRYDIYPEDCEKCNFDYTCGFFKIDGITKCKKEDVYDRIIGERIAESKMQIKAYQKISTTIINEYLDSEIEKFRKSERNVIGLNLIKNKLAVNIETEQNHIYKLHQDIKAVDAVCHSSESSDESNGYDSSVDISTGDDVSTISNLDE